MESHSKTKTGSDAKSHETGADKDQGDKKSMDSTNAKNVSFEWEHTRFTEQEQKHLDYLSSDAYGQIYRRIGYYASLRQTHLGEAGLQELCVVEAQPFDKRLAECDELLARKQQFFSNQLQALDTQLDKEKDNIKLFIEVEQPRLGEELTQLKAEIAQADNDLTTLRKELATKKEQLSGERFKKLKDELTQIADFSEEYRKKAKESLDKHTPESMIAYHDWLSKWRARLEISQYDVATRLHNLSSAGFSVDEKASYRHLYAGFGLLATVVAGWLFSIYTSSAPFPVAVGSSKPTVFSGQSIVSILVQAFLDYASHVGGIRFTLYGLGAIVAITVLLVLCDKLNTFLIIRRSENLGISSKKTRQELQNKQIEIESDFEQPDAFFKLNLRASNWLELWFKLAPALVILLPVVSVIGFLIRNPPSGESIYEQYFYPFYNALYGSWIALAFAGIFYIYLIRKLEKPTNELKASRWPGIGLLLVAFFVFLLALGIDYVVDAIKIQQVALVGFGCMSIVAGVCIGYYLRVSSLLQSQWLYQEEIFMIARFISHFESIGRVELLRAEVDAATGALWKYSKNTAIIIDMSYALEIPKYYQETETHILEQEDKEATSAAPPHQGTWQIFAAFWRRNWNELTDLFRSETSKKASDATTKQAKRTWVHNVVKPPKQLKVSDQILFPVLAEAIDLKYEEYCTKQLRKEQLLNELRGPHTAPHTLLGRLYAQIEFLENKKKPLIAEAATSYSLYEKQHRIIQAEKKEALLHLLEGYFAQQWENSSDAPSKPVTSD